MSSTNHMVFNFSEVYDNERKQIGLTEKSSLWRVGDKISGQETVGIAEA